MDVEWRDIPGWEGLYQVSNQGQVKSVTRRVRRGSGTQLVRERILRLVPNGKGRYSRYKVANLSRNGQRTTREVHRLVLRAFTGEPPDGMEACHNDGDSLNNVISNLRWDTISNNQLDRVAHGRHHNALKTACKRGHPFTEENTGSIPNQVGRYCKTCYREAGRKTRQRKAALR